MSLRTPRRRFTPIAEEEQVPELFYALSFFLIPLGIVALLAALHWLDCLTDWRCM